MGINAENACDRRRQSRRNDERAVSDKEAQGARLRRSTAVSAQRGRAKGVGAELVINADECWNHEMEHVPGKRLRSGGSEHDSLRHC